MRILIRVLIALAALLVAALVVLAILLPRLVESDAVRERIHVAVHDATGLFVRYDGLDVGVLPPRLVVEAPRLGPEDEAADPVFQAETLSLRLALAPLLARTLLVDSFSVEAPELRLVRTEEGFTVPGLPEKEEEPEEQAAPSEPSEPKAEEGEGFALAVRRISIERAHILVEDRTLSPAVTFEISDGNALVTGAALNQRADFEASGTLSSGGRLSAKGQANLGGDLDARVELDAVSLAALAPYMESDQSIGGFLNGTLQASGSLEAPALKLELELVETALSQDAMSLRGPVRLEAELSSLDPPTGPFSLDAEKAELLSGDDFRKPAGVAASVRGRLAAGPDDKLLVEDAEILLHNLTLRGRVEGGDRTVVILRAEPFELAGWEELAPGLADFAPSGKVGFEELRITTDPLDVRGAIDLGQVRARKGSADVIVQGRIEAVGDAIQGEQLSARVADQEFRVSFKLADLAGTPRLNARLDADAVDTGVLLTALTEDESKLQGALRLRSEFAGPLGGDGALLEQLSGTLRFDIAPGRLEGVSFLKSTFEGLGSAGKAALLAGKLSDEKSVQRFYEDEFERLGGTFTLAKGRASTENLRLDYQHYQVDLRGSLGLVAQDLDFTGKLTINEEIDAVISDTDGEPAQGRRRVIPLARVTGTVSSPKVSITSDAALTFAGLYATDKRRDKWEKKLDERLGDGAGKDVLNILDSILSGDSKGQAPAEPAN